MSIIDIKTCFLSFLFLKLENLDFLTRTNFISVFSSLDEKRAHYVEMQVYQCKRCYECLPSEPELRNMGSKNLFHSANLFRTIFDPILRKHKSTQHKIVNGRKRKKRTQRSVKNDDGLYTCRITRIGSDIPR